MHPAFREMMLRDNERELVRNVHDAYLRHERRPAAATPDESVILRLSRVRDGEALDRLAALEGRPASKGTHVVAEVSGVVVAALPLDSRRALADPFRPTAHLIPLLELRAKQLAEDRPRRRPRTVWQTVRNWSSA